MATSTGMIHMVGMTGLTLVLFLMVPIPLFIFIRWLKKALNQ